VALLFVLVAQYKMEASARWLMLLALFAFATSSAWASFVPSGEAGLNDAVPRRWTVNLDLPPEQRWPWPAMLPYYGGGLQHAVEMIGQFIPEEYTSVIVGIAEEIGRMGYLGEYGGEIASVAKAANMSLGEAVLLNLIYEIEAGCTSIVAQGTDGTIYHGRAPPDNFCSFNICLIIYLFILRFRSLSRLLVAFVLLPLFYELFIYFFFVLQVIWTSIWRACCATSPSRSTSRPRARRCSRPRPMPATWACSRACAPAPSRFPSTSARAAAPSRTFSWCAHTNMRTMCGTQKLTTIATTNQALFVPGTTASCFLIRNTLRDKSALSSPRRHHRHRRFHS
jgi:hypothetical protein